MFVQSQQSNNGNIKTMSEIYSKLITKTPERRQRCRSGVFTITFKLISHLVLEFLSLILNK